MPFLSQELTWMGFWRKTAFSSSHKHSTGLSSDDIVHLTSQTGHQLTCRLGGHRRPSQYPPWTGGPSRCFPVTSATGRAGGSELCCTSLKKTEKKSQRFGQVHCWLSPSFHGPPFPSCPAGTFPSYTCAHAGPYLHCPKLQVPLLPMETHQKTKFSAPPKAMLPTWKSEIIINLQLPFLHPTRGFTETNCSPA